MKAQHLIRIALLSVILFVGTSTAFAGFDVSSWSLLSFVADYSGSSVGSDYERLTIVHNPLLQSTSAAIGSNTAMSHYDISWVQDAASFNQGFSTSLDEPDILERIDSSISIRSDQQTELRISGALDFTSVPGDLMAVLFKVSIRDETDQQPQVIFSTSRVGGNLTLLPSSGSLMINDQINLEPDRDYVITWHIFGDSLAEPNPAGPLTIDGTIQFELTTIPEPATALLVVIATSIVGSRYRRPVGPALRTIPR